MCAKFKDTVSKLLPEGALKEAARRSYYRLYYNARHFSENDFYVFYKSGHYEFRFSNGVKFSAYEKMTDELARSLKGYLAGHRIRERETIVDCGAYIGEFTLYAAKAVGPAGKVIAFEPDPAIYKRLAANIQLNGLSNVIIVNKGVWSNAGFMKFVGNETDGYTFMSASAKEGAIDVPVATVDAELERLGVTKVDFIKMDIEGAELEAIKGADKTLKNNNADLAIASYHNVNGKKSFEALEAMLPAFGYKTVTTGNPRHLTTYAHKN